MHSLKLISDGFEYMNDEVDPVEVAANAPLYTWSAERVAQEIEQKFSRELANKFLHNVRNFESIICIT